MKSYLKAIGVILTVGFMVSCQTREPTPTPAQSTPVESTPTTEGPGESTDSTVSVDDSDGGTDTPSKPEKQTYRISLIAPTGVTASLDKTEAAEGEVVTLTIDEVLAGYRVTSVVLHSYSDTELTSTDNRTYTFTMPDRTVTVQISVEVEGKITLVGDFAAALNLNPETGIYEARNVKVEGTSDTAYFSYQVTGEDGKTVKLTSLDVDYRKCFADVQFVFSGREELSIATGCTYDFFYDPSAPCPCYVRRVKVDVLPSSADALYDLFDGNIRSESTIVTPDVTHIDYHVRDTDDKKLNTAVMDRYEDGSLYMTVRNEFTGNDYFTYKTIDKEKNQLVVIDNYPEEAGNDDRTRTSNMHATSYSGRYDIDSNLEESTRFSVTPEDAEYYLNSTAHQMSYVEDDIMTAYRVGVDPEWNDEISTAKVSVSSEGHEDGSFTTTIDTYVEYTNNTTYGDARNQCYTYDVTLDFDVRGALTGLDYDENHYDSENWNFTSHAPSPTAQPVGTKQIEGSWTYGGEVKTGSPANFNPADYFIQSFDTVHFYDPKTGKSSTDGKNYLHYNDKVLVAGSDPEDRVPNVEVKYSPETALDLWEYAPTSSSNTDVIDKTPSDLYNEMTCVGLGTSTVTLTNHTQNSGIQKQVEIEVVGVTKFHSISLDWTKNPMVSNTDAANIYAGTTERYDVILTPADAPFDIEATVDPTYSSLLTVTPDNKNHQLVVTAAAEASITEPTPVTVSLTSEWMDGTVSGFDHGTGQPYYNITITVLPLSQTPVGSWKPSDDDTITINLTAEDYEGASVIDGFTDPKKGTVVDTYYGYNDVYYFYYEFTHGTIKTHVYDIQTNDPQGFDYEAIDVTLDLSYAPDTDVLSAGMYYTVVYEDQGMYVDNVPIIGMTDEEGYIYTVECVRI